MLTEQQLRRIQKPGPVVGGNHRGTGVRSGEKQAVEENGTRLVLSGYGCSAAGWEVGQAVGVSRRGAGSSRPCRRSGGFYKCFITSGLFISPRLLCGPPPPHRAPGEPPAMMRRGPALSAALELDG